MLTLLCLIFIGQSIASSVMFYHMPSMNMVMQEHHMMDYGDMQKTEVAAHVSDSESTSEDCCSQEMYCFVSVCAMVSAISRITNTDFFSGKSLKITSTNSLITSQALTSLYRPPILS